MSTLRVYSLLSVVSALVIRYIWIYLSTTEYCYIQITTLSSAHSQANCFTVSQSGYFKAVYAKPDLHATQDGYVLPGLWDGHGHILQYGEMLYSVDLFQSQSKTEIRTRIADYLETHPDEGNGHSWIRGMGWDQAGFGGVMPTAVGDAFLVGLIGAKQLSRQIWKQTSGYRESI